MFHFNNPKHRIYLKEPQRKIFEGKMKVQLGYILEEIRKKMDAGNKSHF
jgi:hypothetical protein